MPVVIGAILLWITLAVTMIGSWLTHVVSCIQNEQWIFLIAGAICAPVGMVHGIGIWLGVW